MVTVAKSNWLRVLAVVGLLAAGCEAPPIPQSQSTTPGSTAQASPATLGAAKPIEPGIQFYETTLQRAGVPMKVWLYVPDGAAGKKLPCVVVAPAGSNLITGMGLGDGDRAEHLPYARKGFVVVSYEIDGAVDTTTASEPEMITAIKKFKAAQGGVLNARAAVDFAVANVPAIDADRIYAAGHSSAATLALQFATDDDRIAGCVAFAPATDLEARLGAQLIRQLDSAIPGFGDFIASTSPRRRTSNLTCPVFIFHAQDDDNVKHDEVDHYVRELKRSNDRVTFVVVPNGGHYEPMIDEGLPRAIDWLSESK